MKKLAIVFSLLLFLLIFIPQTAHAASAEDRIIIKFHPTVSSQTRDAVINQFPASIWTKKKT